MEKRLLAILVVAVMLIAGCTFIDDLLNQTNEKAEDDGSNETLDDVNVTVDQNDTDDDTDDELLEPQDDDDEPGIGTAQPCDEDVNGDWYYCITEEAVAAKDITICEQIPVSEEESLKRCLKIVAQNSNSKYICEELQTTEAYDICKSVTSGAGSVFY